jgi:GNAT superfamily N-acetyltransferase
MNEALQALAVTVRLADPDRLPLRLRFGLSCARRVAHLLEDSRAMAAIAALQSFTEGRCTDAAFQAARQDVEAAARSHPGSVSIDGAAHAAVSATHAVAHALAGRALEAASYAAYATVYAYSGSAVTDPSAFEDEFRWQVEALTRLAAPAAVRIRPFQAGDEQALWQVFHSSVRTLAAAHYSTEQIDAWSPAAPDMAAWSERIRRIRPFVALDGETPVGYADVQPDGHIDHFFVAGPFARRGVGTALMRQIEASARDAGMHELHANVSLAAEPFFRHLGFELVQRNPQNTIRGVVVPNARMRKRLVEDQRPER